MELNFKDWLRTDEESMTSTGSVANVPMRWGPGGIDIVRRQPPALVNCDDDPAKKKVKKAKGG